jgi:circadian clock protein KaiC
LSAYSHTPININIAGVWFLMDPKKVSELPRVATKIKGFDQLVEGGFPKGSSIMVRGSTGTGKTIFCLQYLYQGAVESDEPGVYISFLEDTEKIFRHGRRFGWDLKALEKKNKIAVLRYEPHEVASIMEEGGGLLRDDINAIGTRRLVVDSLTAYGMVFENKYQKSESIKELFGLLNKCGTTSLVTMDSEIAPSHTQGNEFGFLTDGIINLYYLRGQEYCRPRNFCRVRALEILKMKDTNHFEGLKSYKIAQDGFRILGELKRHGK